MPRAIFKNSRIPAKRRPDRACRLPSLLVMRARPSLRLPSSAQHGANRMEEQGGGSLPRASPPEGQRLRATAGGAWMPTPQGVGTGVLARPGRPILPTDGKGLGLQRGRYSTVR